MKSKIGKAKKSIRIWLPDSVEKDGGSWYYANLHDVTITYTDLLIGNDGIIDIENTIDSFDGCIIEEIKSEGNGK